MNGQTYKKIMRGHWGALTGKKKSKGFCNRLIRRIVGRKTKKEVEEATEGCRSQVIGADC